MTVRTARANVDVGELDFLVLPKTATWHAENGTQSEQRHRQPWFLFRTHYGSFSSMLSLLLLCFAEHEVYRMKAPPRLLQKLLPTLSLGRSGRLSLLTPETYRGALRLFPQCAYALSESAYGSSLSRAISHEDIIQPVREDQKLVMLPWLELYLHTSG